MLSPGRDGVLGTLKQCTSPKALQNTKSVKVPPTSVPIAQRVIHSAPSASYATQHARAAATRQEPVTTLPLPLRAWAAKRTKAGGGVRAEGFDAIPAPAP